MDTEIVPYKGEGFDTQTNDPYRTDAGEVKTNTWADEIEAAEVEEKKREQEEAEENDEIEDEEEYETERHQEN